MNWPTSQDYNEAIQSAATSFSDPSLKNGEVVVNAIGLPVPRSGNFADVYEFKGADGKKWALKCFTRKVAGLQERYAKIDEHIGKANFPFTVGFNYLTDGIRVRGQWFPLLKMEWVEGFTLNEFVRDNADKPKYLHALMQMWAKLCARLRDGNFAHADLQHGNVLLVPGDAQNKLGLKLIDYDGMWVPALAEMHSGEIGHPNFQHPLRLKERLYNAEVDRFPHLVIATALRATLLGGKALWDKFDNGDNLLFKEADLRDPAKAAVFKTLWDLRDNVLCVLLGKMALASKDPLRKTPWLDDLLLTKEGEKLSDDEENRVMEMLGVGPHFTASKSTAPAAAAALSAPTATEFADFGATDGGNGEVAEDPARAKQKIETSKKRPKKQEAKSMLPIYLGGGVLAVALMVGLIVAASGGKKDPPSPREIAKVEDKDKREPSKVVLPSPKKDHPVIAKTVDPPKKVEPTPIVAPAIEEKDPKKQQAATKPKVANPLAAPNDKTEIRGGGQNPNIFREATDAGVLVGMEVGVGKYGGAVCIRTLKPIFRDGDKETTGKQWGKDKASVITVIAKPGYALEALNVKSSGLVDGFSIIFMKVVDGKLDPKDSYESEWMGGMGGEPKTKLGGDGRQVVGIVGRMGPFGRVNGIGLALKPAGPE